MQWMASQGRFCVFNNVIPIAPILKGTASIPQPLPVAKWLDMRLKKMPPTTLKNILHPLTPLISIEDHELTVMPLKDATVPIIHILIIRDPVNMFASRIRKAWRVDSPAYPRSYNPVMERAVRLWKTYAREFLGHTNILQPKLCISYNAWHTSATYRHTVADQLGLSFDDSAFERVPRIGGGSSFDGTTFNDSGSQMNVLNRASDLNTQEHALLDQIMADEEIRDLHLQIEKLIASTQP
jgi:hypothetical protein